MVLFSSVGCGGTGCSIGGTFSRSFVMFLLSLFVVLPYFSSYSCIFVEAKEVHLITNENTKQKKLQSYWNNDEGVEVEVTKEVGSVTEKDVEVKEDEDFQREGEEQQQQERKLQGAWVSQSCNDDEDEFTLFLRTDQTGYETYWTLERRFRNNYNIVAEGGTSQVLDQSLPNREALQDNNDALDQEEIYEEKVCMNKNEEYKFTIYDWAGDGICCQFGNGQYRIFINDVEYYMSDGNFGFSEEIIINDIQPTSTPDGPPETPPLYDTIEDGSFNNCNNRYRFFAQFVTDSFAGTENVWRITNLSNNNDIVHQSDTLLPDTVYEIRRCLLKNRDYEFTIIDSYGDGIGSDDGNGFGNYYRYYIEFEGNGNEITIDRTTIGFTNGEVVNLQTGFVTPHTLDNGGGGGIETDIIQDGTFDLCGNNRYLLVIDILTDDWPGDLSWTISDYSGSIEVSSNNYVSISEQNTLYQIGRCFSYNDNYIFTINDSANDGLGDPGYWKLSAVTDESFAEYNGDRLFGTSASVYLPELVSVDGGTNGNNQPDDIVVDGTFNSNSCNGNKYEVLIEILTDDWPEETSWVITGLSSQTIIYSSDADTINRNNVLYQFKRCLAKGQDYAFTINDLANDGINQPGYWQITVDDDGPYIETYISNFGTSASVHIPGLYSYNGGGGGGGNEVDPPVDVRTDGSFTGDACSGNKYQLLIEIRTDQWPGETTWEITTVSGDYVMSSAESNVDIELVDVLYQIRRCLPKGEQYIFKINDGNSDGLFEPGYYQLKLYDDNDEDIYYGFSAFGSSACVQIPNLVTSDNCGSGSGGGTGQTRIDGDFDNCNPNDYELLIMIGTDTFASETSWQITNAQSGELEDSSNFPLAISTFENETPYEIYRCLSNGNNYVVTIFDTFGDGLTGGLNGYFQIVLDGIVFAPGIPFTFSQSVTIPGLNLLDDGGIGPTPGGTIVQDGPYETCNSNEIEILIIFETDLYPTETSWDIIRNDGSQTTYSSSDSESISTFDVDTTYEIRRCIRNNRDYTFNLYDSYGDGICCGDNLVEVSLSNSVTTFTHNGVFQNTLSVSIPELEQVFNTVTDGTFNGCSSNSNYQFTLTLMTDNYPSETSWTIYDENNIVVFTSPDDGTAYSPLTLYEINRCLPKGSDYLFTISDTFGDGLCCESSYTISIDNLNTNNNFFNGDGQFGYGQTISLPSFSIENPTNIDGSFDDCSSSQNHRVTIYIKTDSYPFETTWDITNVNTDEVLFSSLESNAIQFTTPLAEYEIRRCVPKNGEYIFTIYDSYGDGLTIDGYYIVEIPGDSIQPTEAFTVSQSVSIPDLVIAERGNVIDGSFDSCRSSDYELLLELYTDAYPTELSWEIMNSQGNIEASSSDPGANSIAIRDTIYEVRRCLSSDQDYTLTIIDSFGDGIAFPGGYRVEVDGQSEYIGDGTFGLSVSLSIPDLNVEVPVIVDGNHAGCGSPRRITIILVTDSFPAETTWEISNFDTGNVIFASTDFDAIELTVGSTQYEIKRCLPVNPRNQFYLFTIRDSFGDGLIDPAFYQVTYDNEDFIGQGNFGTSQSVRIPDLELIEPNREDGSFDDCVDNEYELYFAITTDSFPGEQSWDIVNSDDGSIVYASSDFGAIYPFTEADVVYEIIRCLPRNNNYILNIYDGFGDGICCGALPEYGFVVDYNGLGGQINVDHAGDFGLGASINLQTGESIGASTCNDGEVIINLTTDNSPQQTTWTILDFITLDVVATGSYTSPNTFNEDKLCLPGDYYAFVLEDVNGLRNGASFSVKYNGNVVGGGSEFTSESIVYFSRFQDRSVYEAACNPQLPGILFQLNLLTDQFPGETSWEITDPNGIVVSNGSGYESPGTEYEEYRCLSPIASNQEYIFTIYDGVGDGICCSDEFGRGNYSIRFDGKNAFESNGDFGQSETTFLST